MIFVNLFVQDLEKLKVFFIVLGYSFNLIYINDDVVGMVISESIYVMLLIQFFFQQFINKLIVDVYIYIEVINVFLVFSCKVVDELVDKVLVVGVSELQLVCDYGFMYQCGFQDLDGYFWEIVYMDGELG